MGSDSKLELPLIDFTQAVNPESSSWLLASKNVQFALEKYGAFVAIFDKVTPELRDTVLLATKEMFELPEDTRKLNLSKVLPHFGYLGKEYFPNRLHFESLGIEKATSFEDVKYFTNLMWPSGNDNFCETMHSFATIMSELEQTVTKMLFERYGVENYDSHKELCEYLLRYVRLEGLEKDEKVEGDMLHGLPAHTDKSLLTILYQNDIGFYPLQIVTKNGESILVEIPPNSYLVMAGDALSGWSNGRITSGLHKTEMSGTLTRYTVLLFTHFTGTVEVPKQLVDDENPLKFKPFNNFDLLSFSTTKEGKKAENALKAFCGI